MNEATIRSLNAINRRFYDERAGEFDRTRERAWRGWVELFDRYGSRIASTPSVLDVGCGNGRFARFLRQRLGAPFTYVGVDASELGLDHARERLKDFPRVELYRHDFIVESDPVPSELRAMRFDLIVLFGVLHHVPGRERRVQLLSKLAHRLSSGGVLVYTVWRFERFERFTRKLVSWDGFDVDRGELEPGDHIMTWGDDDPGYRYCHAMSDDEAAALERSLPLDALGRFAGDNELNDYFTLTRK